MDPLFALPRNFTVNVQSASVATDHIDPRLIIGTKEIVDLSTKVAHIQPEGVTFVQVLEIYDAIEAIKKAEADLTAVLPTESDVLYKPLQRQLKDMHEARKHVSSLVSISNKLSIVRNWISSGYDRSIIETDPEGVQFVGEGDLTFSIKMYKDAKVQLLDADMDLKIVEGKVQIKVEGVWRLCSEIADTIVFDKVEKKYKGWTYTHPNGFVPVDSMDWNELTPCAQLSPDALKTIQEKAQLFWKTHTEIDPGVEKKCTLQVACTAGGRFLPDIPLLRNVESMLPRHVRIRMIDEEGHVYSFSTKMEKSAADYVLGLLRLGDDTGFSLRTADAKIVSPDYEETRKFLHSDVASIPMSAVRFHAIKDVVERVNGNGGVRFCFSKRNCCRFSQKILKLAGVSVDTKIDGPTFLYRILPDVTSLPYIGRPVAAVSKVISRVFEEIKSCFFAIAPVLKPMCQWVQSAVTFVPRKLGAMVLNLLFSKLGGSEGLPSKIKDGTESRIASSRFKQLLSSAASLFDMKSNSMYHARLMCEWIQKQGSYQAFDNRSSGLCVVDV